MPTPIPQQHPDSLPKKENASDKDNFASPRSQLPIGQGDIFNSSENPPQQSPPGNFFGQVLWETDIPASQQGQETGINPSNISLSRSHQDQSLNRPPKSKAATLLSLPEEYSVVTNNDSVGNPPGALGDAQSDQREVTLSSLAHRIDVPIGRRDYLANRIKEREDVLSEKRSRLKDLEIKIARFGYNTPSEVSIEHEAIEKEIDQANLELGSLQLERRLNNRYVIELGTLATAQGILALAQGNAKTSVSDALILAETLYPEIFGANSILLGMLPDRLASKIGSPEAIDREVADLKLKKNASLDAQLIAKRRESLLLAKERLEGGHAAASHTPWRFEPQDVELPRFPAETKVSIDFAVGKDRYTRVAVLEVPDDIEDEERADALLLYEVFAPGDTTKQKARLAICYLTPAQSSKPEMTDLRKLATDLQMLSRELCKVCTYPKLESTNLFRFPGCMQFVQLFDETLTLDDQLLRGRLPRVPLCKLEYWETTGLSDLAFNALYAAGQVGSNWIEQEHLPGIYNHLKAHMPTSIGFVVHSQTYSYSPKTKASRNDASQRD